MQLTRHATSSGPRWACDGEFLEQGLTLGELLAAGQPDLRTSLSTRARLGPAMGALMAPLDSQHEVWAAGVTYLRSREAREAESDVADVYERVYSAARPELFFKGLGWRAVGHEGRVRLRQDSRWNVPEPELALVVDAAARIVGYCVGNDMSSRDIEGANPLYLPQAKVFDGSLALGPCIEIASEAELTALDIKMTIERGGRVAFQGETQSSQIKRSLAELVSYLYRELQFPNGVVLLTGTGIVPPDDFSLQAGDIISIAVGSLLLESTVGPASAK